MEVFLFALELLETPDKCFVDIKAFQILMDHTPGCFKKICLFCCFSLAKRFQESYIESGGASSFCNKAFASWDFCISDENAAKVKSQNIVQTVRVSIG